MKMRKVLSLVLALALVLGSFSMAFATTFTDVAAGSNVDEAVSVLADLGVIDGYADGTYKPAGIVTRAEMAKLIIVALGLEDFATSTTSTYPDMAGAAWAQGYVAYATSLGIIEGYPDGTFKPSQTVSYNEACAMIVRALGYTAEFLPGGWPAEWVVKAQTLGILDNITAASATGANRGDIAIMLYNALNLQIGYVNNEGDFVLNTPTDTMLIRLGAEQYNSGNAFLVDYTIADGAVANLMPYIGAYITAYQNKDDKVIAVNEVKSTFLTGTLNTAGTKFKAGDVEYTISSATVLSGGAVEFYNADKTGTLYTTVGAIASGIGTDEVTLAVKVSGTTIKTVYSVMTWDVDADAFFAADDASDISEDNSLLGFDFPTDDSGVIDTELFALNGAASLSDIATDDVVYVYALGGTGKIVRVDVGTETVSGEITKISGTINTDAKYYIAGTAYEEAVDMASSTLTSPKAGDEVTLILDYAGNVYKIEKLSGEADNYAVVIDATAYTASSFSDTKVKMMVADGTISTYVVDMDEVTSTEYSAANVSKGAIVKYALNSDGQVDDIITAGVTTTLSGIISETGYFNNKRIASDAIIFTYDASTLPAVGSFSNDTGLYDVTTRANVLDSEGVVAYAVEKDGLWVALLINNAAATSEDVYGVITAFASIVDNKWEVTMLVDGAAKTYTATSGASNYNLKTDLVTPSFNTAGNVTAFTTIGAATSTAAGRISTWTVVTAGSMTITNNVVNAGSGVTAADANISGISLTDNVIVYKWNATKYEKGTTRDITNAVATKTIKFYSTDKDNPGVASIVVIK